MVIYIKDLVVKGKHGVNPEEKLNPQRFSVSVELTVASDTAAQTDNINDTIDWSDLKKLIIKIVADNSFNLVEHLAQEIANQILLDKRVNKAQVTIDKLDAFASGVPGVQVEASN